MQSSEKQEDPETIAQSIKKKVLWEFVSSFESDKLLVLQKISALVVYFTQEVGKCQEKQKNILGQTVNSNLMVVLLKQHFLDVSVWCQINI